MAAHHSIAHHPPARVRWPWALVSLAWALAALAALTNQRTLLDHHFLLEESGLPWLVAVLIFLACWQTMIVAMLLPSSMPAVSAVVAAVRGASRRVQTLGAFLAGYACIWTAFGLLAFAGDTLIHRAVDESPWLATHAFLIGATTLLVAGAFQLSHWKSSFLARCHNPEPLAVGDESAQTWHTGPAWRLGLRHGWVSTGCCWALMVVMFGIGAGGLGWMAGLTCVMVGETIAPDSKRIVRAIGIVLLLLGGLWLLHPAWLVPTAAS